MIWKRIYSSEKKVNRYTHHHNKVVSTILGHILGYARLSEVTNV
jgi:hypothetical protein